MKTIKISFEIEANSLEQFMKVISPFVGVQPAVEEEAPKAESKKPPTMTELRQAAAVLSKAGKKDELKAIFAKYGAEKLSAVPAEKYAELLEDFKNA